MDTVKKIFRFLSSILFYSVMLILVVVAIMFIAYYVDRQIGLKKGENRSPLFGAYIIISESMIPSINVYDAVLTIRASEDDIEKYDIIEKIRRRLYGAKPKNKPMRKSKYAYLFSPRESRTVGARRRT